MINILKEDVFTFNSCCSRISSSAIILSQHLPQIRMWYGRGILWLLNTFLNFSPLVLNLCLFVMMIGPCPAKHLWQTLQPDVRCKMLSLSTPDIKNCRWCTYLCLKSDFYLNFCVIKLKVGLMSSKSPNLHLYTKKKCTNL